MLSHQACCYQLLVYDWEAGGSVGDIAIPLDTSGVEVELSCDMANNTTNNDSGN